MRYLPNIVACVLSLAAFPLPAQVVAPPTIDEQKAWRFLVHQVELGPRVPTSEAHRKTREFILRQLAESGCTTFTQTFHAYAPLLAKNVEGVNIVGITPKDSKTASLVLSAHYDTRPSADMEMNPDKRHQPIPGANDGASGVAVLLAVADALQETPPPKPLAFVFFDLEDSGQPTDVKGYCLGSRYMAANLPPQLAEFELGINFDMVGKKDLHLPMEQYSLRAASDEVRVFWAVGAQVAPNTFVKQQGIAIYDDHVPFLERGKKFINVIDFDYSQWHTTDDSVEQCSSESLKAVGDTVLKFLFQ
ncbi:MAG: M28 family peptidase [Candidatus Sumerlaeaceae bacterium]|jgi:Zn-dependent M28 family amino/carboxypeptidase